VKLSIDGKVIAKARATSKESRRKASQRTYFALQEKWTKIISYSSKLHRFRS
jgi:ribonuclease-3